MCSNGVRFSITTMAPPTPRLLLPLFSTRASISLFDALTPSSTGLVFPKETISQVAEALAGFHRTAVTHGVPQSQFYIFATEAMRRADNAGEMLSAIEGATNGIGVQILEPAVETLCGAVMGSRSGFVGVPGGALFLDLGGGSVQMTWVDTDIDGYEINAATTGTSMGYGAAKLIRILEEKPAETQTMEIETLRTSMANAFGALCAQFPALKAIVDAHRRGEDANLKVFMCGGGFRGYGYMLMHDDPISPYPIPSVATYTVEGARFKQTAKMLSLNQTHEGKIFGMSSRRRRQFPAIVHVVEAFIGSVPNIEHVTFCGGSNRQGALMMMLPKEVRESNPLEALAAIAPAEKPIFDAVVQLLTQSLPQEVTKERIPTVLEPGLANLFARDIWIRAGYDSDANKTYALHNALIRDPECPGLTHVARAALGLTTSARWGSKYAPVDASLAQGLQRILAMHHADAPFWAQYLGGIAALLATLLPFQPRSAAELLNSIK